MDDAISQGIAKVEAAVLSGALCALFPELAAEAGAEPLPPMTVEDAFHLLLFHHPKGKRRRQRSRPTPPRPEVKRKWTDEAILDRLEKAVMRYAPARN